MEIESDFGERLKEVRKARKLTQAQLANRLNVSTTTISEYESSMSFPQLEKFIKLVQILNISADYLLGFKAEKRFDLSGLTENQRNLLENNIDSFADEFRKLNK